MQVIYLIRTQVLVYTGMTIIFAIGVYHPNMKTGVL